MPAPSKLETKKNTRLSAFTDDALGKHDAVGLIEKIQRQQTSSNALIAAALARVKVINPVLNAATDLRLDVPTDDSAMQSTAFHGIPTFIKDLDDLAGMQTRAGSRATGYRIAKRDGPFIAQIKGLGLIPLGKSSTPEFGLTATTESFANGLTRNPWHIDYSCGGSSGGAAALVAAGVVPIAHGNDGGGSIRIPASVCGLVGLKPSRGRILMVPDSEKLPVNIAHQGVLTRSLRDTVHFYQSIQTHFPRQHGFEPITALQAHRHVPRKIALWNEDCDPECKAAVDRAADLLADAGHQIEHISKPFSDHLGDDFLHYWSFLAFAIKHFGRLSISAQFDKTKLEPFTHNLSREFVRNMFKKVGAFYRLRAFEQEYEAFFSKYDALLNPTLGTPPPRLGYLNSGNSVEDLVEKLSVYTQYTPYQNISGGPAISMPINLSPEGLPIGVQISSRLGADNLVLALASDIECRAQWQHLCGELSI